MPNMSRTPLRTLKVLEESEDLLSDKLTELFLSDIDAIQAGDEISQLSRDLKQTYEKYKNIVTQIVQSKIRCGATH